MSSDYQPIKPGEELPALDKQQRKPKATQRKAAGRFAVLNEFVDTSMHDLTRSELAVWLVLYRNVRDGKARLSAGGIANVAGMSRRSATAAIGSLRRKGLLTVIYKGGQNRGASTYRVNGGSPLHKP